MSEPISEATADVQGKNKTGSEVDRTPRNETSITSLSGESTNASRNASRIPVPTSTARGRTARTSNDDFHTSEPWMETVTAGKFAAFQAAIFFAIEHIVAKPEYQNHPFTKKWNKLKRVPKTPMSSKINWRYVKVILNVRDVFEYKTFLQQCPTLSEYIRIQPSLTTNRGFDFGVYDYSSLSMEDNLKPSDEEASISNDTDAPTTPEENSEVQIIPPVTPKTIIQELDQVDNEENLPSPHAQAPIFPPFTQLSDDTDESYVEVQKEVENPNLTPKQGNTTVKNTDDSTITLGTTDNLSLPKDIAWSTDDNATGFRLVHHRLFDSVTVWMQEERANKSPFMLKWRKAIFEGLTGLTKWEKVAKMFKLQYLRDYVTLMY